MTAEPRLPWSWPPAGRHAARVTALWEMDAITLAGMMRGREVSAREVIAAHIGRIEAVDPAVNAVVTRSFDQAMAKAAAADQALARGEPPGLLHGLPVAHKDLVDTAKVRTTYGLTHLSSYLALRWREFADDGPAAAWPGSISGAAREDGTGPPKARPAPRTWCR